MLKLMLMSILFASLLVPISISAGKNPRRAFRRVVATMAVVLIAYCFFLYFLYERFL